MATSAESLTNAVQSSPKNTASFVALVNLWYKDVNELAVDLSQTWQTLDQFDYAVLQAAL